MKGNKVGKSCTNKYIHARPLPFPSESSDNKMTPYFHVLTLFPHFDLSFLPSVPFFFCVLFLWYRIIISTHYFPSYILRRPCCTFAPLPSSSQLSDDQTRLIHRHMPDSVVPKRVGALARETKRFLSKSLFFFLIFYLVVLFGFPLRPAFSPLKFVSTPDVWRQPSRTSHTLSPSLSCVWGVCLEASCRLRRKKTPYPRRYAGSIPI